MSNQTYGPPPGGCCPHGQMYSPCPKCLKPDSKLYVPCDDCKFDEDSEDCQQCEFEQALNSIIGDTMGKEYAAILGQLRSTDDKDEKAKLIARGLEIGKAHETITMRIDLAAKDETIKGLESLRDHLYQALEDASDDHREALKQLRTELAEERRLKDEERLELCETKTHNHPAGYTAEEYARNRDWGYLYEKEQGK